MSSVAGPMVSRLIDRSQTVATAESLTGGLVGVTLTDVPGSSAVYLGGLIVYATELKGTLAGVPEEILERDGAVAATTAGELALGAARRCHADWGVSTTGVAGPEGQEGHPPGTVFVGVARDGEVVEVQRLALSGDRESIRRQTVERALDLLLKHLD